MVTPEARRAAKAVNFGIVYGISAFGLAAQLGISRDEAEKYIRNYFERYAGVRRFIDATIAEVRQTGVTRTMFGRERPIPDINSRNPNARGFAERTAVNSPLQGTAADLIKLAMVRIDAALEAAGHSAAMLLQVHDELVFECPPEEVEAVSSLVKREMEGVRAAGRAAAGRYRRGRQLARCIAGSPAGVGGCPARCYFPRGSVASSTSASSVRAFCASVRIKYRCLPSGDAWKCVCPCSSTVIRPGADTLKYPPSGRSA